MTDTPKKAPGVPMPAEQQQPLTTMSNELLAATELDSGDAFRPDPADLILPLITVFQSNSPGIDKRSPDYIAGAEAGCFHFRNDLIPICDGVVGFDAIPVWEEKLWLEWGQTRGSGLFGRHLSGRTMSKPASTRRTASGRCWSAAAPTTCCKRSENFTSLTTLSRTSFRSTAPGTRRRSAG